MFRKLLTFAVVVTTIVWTMGVAAFVPSASAVTLSAGDLIKASGPAVYFYAGDGMRYTYPHESIYMTWRADFSDVITITDSELASIDLAGNVVVRPGTKLVKITTVPKVYAVEPYGMLRHIDSEDAAKALYGDDWASRVMDVSDAFWPNYTDINEALDGTEYPEGQLVSPEGDSKTYYVNGDGTWSWITTGDAFEANRWKYSDVVEVPSTFSFTTDGEITGGVEEYYDDSQGGGGGSTPGGTGGDLAVAFTGSPASMNIPEGSTGTTVAEFNFTAGSDPVLMTGVSLKRTGLGDEAEISKVYLYEGSNKLTSGRTISASSQLVNFTNLGLNLSAGETVKLSVVVDINPAAATNGYHAFQIESIDAVTSNASAVTGSFPMTSNEFYVSSVVVGKCDVESNGTNYTRKVGETGVTVAEFSVHVDNVEDATFEGITLYNAGRDILENLELYRGSDLVATGVASGDYFVFDLDTPWSILRNDSASFTVKGDVTGRNADKATLYVRYNTDVKVKGNTYGFNLTVDVAEGADAGNSYVEEVDATPSSNTVTAEAGQITVSFNGPATTDYSKNSNDNLLMDFTITAQSAVDVEKTVVNLSGTNLIGTDVDDLEVVCDGVAVTSWAGPAIGDNTSTDVWSLPAGDAVECSVVIDFTNTATGNETIKATLKDLTANWTFKDANTGDAITDIVPSGDIAGNTMNVTAATLDVTLASTPASGTINVKGTEDVETVGFIFTAGDAADVKVNSVKLTGYLDNDDDWGAANNDVNDYNQLSNAEDVMVAVALYDDGSTTPLASAKSLTVGTTAITATFDSLNWTIPAGTSKQLVAKVDLSTTAPVTGTADFFALAIAATGDIDAEYGTGTAIGANFPTSANVDGNAGAVGVAPVIYQKVTDGGELDLAIDADTPDADLVVGGSTDVTTTKVKFTAKDEDFVVEKLRVQNGTGATDANFTSVGLSYTNSLGATETKTQFLSGGFADFTGLDIFVPKDGSAVVDVVANLNTISGGATNGTDVNLDVDVSATANVFRAVGQSSSKVYADSNALPNTPDATDINGNTHKIYETVPTITFASDTPSGNFVPGANTLVAKIKVTAAGNKDLTFDGTAGGSGTDTLDIAVSGTQADNTVAGEAWTLKDGSGNDLDTVAVANVLTTPVQFIFATKDFVVPAGTTKYLYLYMNTTDLEDSGDSIQVWLDDAADANVQFSIDSDLGAYQEAKILFRGDLYGGSLIKP